PDGVVEDLPQLLEQLVVMAFRLRREGKVPPAPRRIDPGRPDVHRAGRWKLADPLEGRAAGGVRPRDEVLGQGGAIELAARPRVFQERLRLRGEPEIPVELGDEQRSDAEPVAREEQLPGERVPDGE